MSKSNISIDKHEWSPSLLPGQVVLISTVDTKDVPNIAPKSWITMVSFEGPIIAFGTNRNNMTYANIINNSEYVINIPSEDIVKRIWSLPSVHGQQRTAQSGFKFSFWQGFRVPLIAECRGHLLCRFIDEKRFGDAVMVFGTICEALMDDDLVVDAVEERYKAIRPIFFLEDGQYGVIEGSHPIAAE